MTRILTFEQIVRHWTIHRAREERTDKDYYRRVRRTYSIAQRGGTRPYSCAELRHAQREYEEAQS